jgi:hypothetical protein
MRTRFARPAAATAVITLVSLGTWFPAAPAAHATAIPPPGHHGTLRVSGTARDGPGQKCKGPHSFGTFCRVVYAVPHGYTAVMFDVDLDGKTLYPCRE